ncbi:MAG: M20 family metallo-hydrolase [Longimicrobiales bacterium]|nr:M20 family metallo-hydrolase [Longimicrobiales bacterium]
MVDGDRLNRRIAELAEFGRTPAGGVTRLAYSEADRQACGWIEEVMVEAGLEVHSDAAGNRVGRRSGSEGGLPPIVMGSHIDSVADGGRYDGPVGSLAAVEVAQSLAEQGITTRHDLEVIVFQNEEYGHVGSRALAGDLSEADLDVVNGTGRTRREGIAFLGGDPSKLDSVRRRPGDVAAFLEVHIEQGEVLISAGADIGVVDGIAGVQRWRAEVRGRANHAGSTPMDRRQDALLAASRFVDAVNRVLTSRPGRQVGTVGALQVFPGAPDIVPGRAELSLDIRDMDEDRIGSFFLEMQAEAGRIGLGTGTEFAFTRYHRHEPVETHPVIREIFEEATVELGLSSRRLLSGAGHDAQTMGKIAPVGLIFIPSVGGVSHSPEEYSRPEDIRNGAAVLLRSVLKLDAMTLE